VLQPFLHRAVNARGRIEREYPLGIRRVDLLVVWPGKQGRAGRFVVECKLPKDGRSPARTIEQGLERTAAYMDLCDADAGHLVVFDMREGPAWAEKVYREERRRNATTVTVRTVRLGETQVQLVATVADPGGRTVVHTTVVHTLEAVCRRYDIDHGCEVRFGRAGCRARRASPSNFAWKAWKRWDWT
jgi:hypothetical protein